MIVGLLLAAAVLCWPPPAAWQAVAAVAGAPEPAGRWAGAWVASLVRWRRKRGSGDDVAAQVEAVAAALRAGLPVSEAWSGLTFGSTAAGEAPAVLRAVTAGRSPAAALRRHARISGDLEWAMAARAWAVSERSGAPLAVALSLAARSGRARRAQDRQVQAAAAGARATMTVLTGLPLAGVLVAAAMGLSPAAVYGNPVGLGIAAAGLPLILVGRRISSRLIRAVERAAA